MCAGLLGMSARAAGGAVVDPHVATDRSVDCRTVDSILKSLVKDGMTDEQKVLAVFHWIRRLIYHGDGPREYAYNFHNMIHIYGHGSCLRQTTPMWVLLKRLGYTCRNWAVGGHHLIQVHYGGQWHLLDPHMNFYVYDRGKPPTIASVAHIKADPTLVTDAVKEGRACPGFLLCGDSVGTFARASAYRDLGDFPESRKYTPVIKEPFGGITLRRGETYIRTWMPGTYWFKKGWYKKDVGPRHGCGRRDRKDTVNWPLYEPHAWGTKYRHWGAGRIAYNPSLDDGHYRDAVVSETNVAAKDRGAVASLGQADAAKPAEIVFGVNCPYVITAGEVRLRQTSDGAVLAAVSIDEGKTWQPVELKADGDRMAALFVDEVNGGFNGYQLTLTLTGGAAVADIELVSHFQLNPYSLPHLVPGKNVVTVDARTYGSPLTVTYNWAEGDDWSIPKTAAATFTKDGSFTIDVAGPKYPRMVSLTLSVAPQGGTGKSATNGLRVLSANAPWL